MSRLFSLVLEDFTSDKNVKYVKLESEKENLIYMGYKFKEVVAKASNMNELRLIAEDEEVISMKYNLSYDGIYFALEPAVVEFVIPSDIQLEGDAMENFSKIFSRELDLDWIYERLHKGGYFGGMSAPAIPVYVASENPSEELLENILGMRIEGSGCLLVEDDGKLYPGDSVVVTEKTKAVYAIPMDFSELSRYTAIRYEFLSGEVEEVNLANFAYGDTNYYDAWEDWYSKKGIETSSLLF